MRSIALPATLVLGVAGLVAVAAPGVAATTDLYVDKTVSSCSDTGSGTAAVPYCTITKAVSQLKPGYTVYIGNGTYAETITTPVSGSASAPVTVTAWPGRSPTVGTAVAYAASISNRAYVTISHLQVARTTSIGIYVSGGDHISILDNEVIGAGQPVKGRIAQGIRLSGTSNGLVQGNYTHHNSDHGIMLNNGTTGMTIAYNVSAFNAENYQRNANGIDVVSPGNSLIGNVTHDNEDSGINFYPGGNNNLAATNVTYNNGDHGIDDLNVTGGRLIGNTVYRNCTSGINVEGTSGNYVVKNNVAVDNAVYPAYNGIACSRRGGNIGIWDSAPASTVVDHNLVWLTTPGKMYVFGSSYTSLSAMQAATHQEQHGVQGDPRFADAPGGNLSVTAGSPAIDRADSGAPGATGTDILNHSRVDDPGTPNTFAEGPRRYDDLGAYEFQGGSVPSAQAPTAALTLTPTSGTAPLDVTADASGSTDPQGQNLTYTFDFGDGTTTNPQTSPTATHTYTTAGTYTAKVTVTNTANLSDTTTRDITVSPGSPSATAPAAALTLTPSSGTAPLNVVADASGSTDPQGQYLTYTFDFGDGTTTNPQTSPTATHTYTTAGTYTARVTVTNTANLSGTTTQIVTVGSGGGGGGGGGGTPPTFVDQIANNYSTKTKTNGYITVWRPGGVPAGDYVVLTLQLSGTAATGPVTATDAAGNTYTTLTSIADTTGNRLVILGGTATNALAPNDRITATFPAAKGGYRLGGDDFTGVSTLDGQATATGTGTGFSSGPASASTLNDLVYGAVSVPTGSGAPAWTTDWNTITGHNTGSTYLSRAYQIAGTTGGYSATGTATGAWLVAAVTLTSGGSTPPAPAAPTAALTLTPTSGTAPLDVTADASGSTDPQGQNLTYTFDFGDGTTTNPQTSPTATHTYTTAGTYTARVTVTNTANLSDTTTRDTTVTTPTAQAPTAALTLTPTSGTAPLDVTADASGSTDPQGQNLTYTFDFGDGTTTNPQTSPTATHTYTTAGTYTAKVTVTNTANLSDTTTRDTTVTTPTAQAPTAALTLTPTSGTAPLNVVADASGSTDPQGQNLTYTFDFGDGTTTNPQTSPTATHTYTTAGTYTARVTVTNTANLSDTTTRDTTVTTPTAQAPTAALTLTPSSGTAPLNVVADASGSTDPQGQNLTYTFDFGDGTTTNPQTSPTATHTYTTAGTYTARVTVTNTANLSGTTTQIVTVGSGGGGGGTPPTFVDQIANNYSTNTKTNGYITVWRSGGVPAGDYVVLTLQLSGTAATGPVTATDAAGNTYTTLTSIADTTGNRLVILGGTATNALAANDRITATFPAAKGGYRLGGDDFTGVNARDTASGALGSGSSFSSGPATTARGNELVFAAVSVPVGTGDSSWGGSWTRITAHHTGSAYLSRAYQVATVAGAYTATGTATGDWLVAEVALR